MTAFVVTLGIFVVVLCWRTLVLTLRIERLEKNLVAMSRRLEGDGRQEYADIDVFMGRVTGARR